MSGFKGRRARGFTLIELLVVIGIVGVLLSISLPALSGARASGQRVASLANTKSIGDTFTALEGERGSWPTKELVDLSGFGGVGMTGGERPMIMLRSERVEGDDVMAATVIAPIWELAGLWPVLVSEWLDVGEHYETWFSPGRPAALPAIDPEEMASGGITPPTSYRYSNSFVARPGLWGPGEAPLSEVVAPVRASDVTRPAAKVLIWDADLAYLHEAPRVDGGHYAAATPMAFADGHADVKLPQEAREGYANRLNGDSAMRLHNTAGGVGGADY